MRTYLPFCVTNRRSVRLLRVKLTPEDTRRILAGLFDLAITHWDDPPELTRIRTLVVKLGGNPEALFFAPTR